MFHNKINLAQPHGLCGVVAATNQVAFTPPTKQFHMKLFTNYFLTFKASFMMVFLMLVGASVWGQVLYDWGGSNCMIPEANVIGKSCTKTFLWNCPIALTCDPYSNRITCTNCNSTADYEVGTTSYSDVGNSVGTVNIKFKTSGTKHIVVEWICLGGFSAAGIDVDIYTQTYTGSTRINNLQSGTVLGQAVPVCRTGQMDLTTTFTPSCGTANNGEIRLNKLTAGGKIFIGTATLPMGTVTRNINTLFPNLAPGSYEVLLRVNEGVSYTTIDNSYFNLHDFTTQLNLTQNTSFCPNSTTTLSANASGGSQLYSYIWSNGATTANINIAQTGTYTVTVTDGSGAGCAATQSTTVTSVTPTLTIVDSDGLCVGSGGTLTATTTNINVSAYRWSTNATTQSIPLTQTGIYTVTVTDNNNCTKTASVTIGEGCCKGGYTTIGGLPSSMTTLTQLKNNGTIPSSWISGGIITVPTNTLLKWVINGKLIVDMPFRVTNFDIRMCENASIDVGTNAIYTSLYLGGNNIVSNIQGFTKMWQGITVKNGSALRIGSNGTNFSTANIVIQDAVTAINAAYDSDITIGSNARIVLQNNQSGIVLAAKPTTAPVSARIAHIASVDIKGGTLKNGAWSEVGIEAYDHANIKLAGNQLGNTQTTCTFDKLESGIKAYNCTIGYFQQVHFTNIQPHFPSSSPTLGTAIFLNNSTFGVSTGYAVNTIQIRDCKQGIYGNNCSFYANGMFIGAGILGIGTQRGIIVMNNSGTNLSIGSSTINTLSTAISISNSLGWHHIADCTINAGLNPAVNNTAQYGIVMSNINMPVSIATCLIQGNQINLTHGIAAVQLSNIPTGTGTPSKVDENTIRLNNSGYATSSISMLPRYALRILNSNDILVKHNNIIGLTAYTSKNTTAVNLFNCNNVVLECNTTRTLGTGINLMGTQIGTKLKTNYIKEHAVGLLYGSSMSGLPPQGQSKTDGNVFLPSHYTDLSSNKSAWNQTAATVQPTGTYMGQLYHNDADMTPDPYKTTNPDNQFIGAAVSPQEAMWLEYTTNTVEECDNYSLTTPSSPNDWAATYSVATGNTETAEFSTEMQWAMQKALYKASLIQPDSVANNPDLQNAVDSLDNTAIAKIVEIENVAAATLTPNAALELQRTALKQQMQVYLVQIDSASIAKDESALALLKPLYIATSDALALLDNTADVQIKAAADNLAALNATMQPITLQEINQKTTNNLYFRYFAKGTTVALRGTDITILEGIAAQCPYTGGNAVFDARGMLASLDRAYVYDDQGTCASQGVALRKAPTKPKEKVNTQTATSIKISPNPASTNFNLSVSEDLLNSIYNIVDATGKVVLSNTISNTKQDIDITNISAGVYYIKIIGNTYEAIKLVIIK